MPRRLLPFPPLYLPPALRSAAGALLLAAAATAAAAQAPSCQDPLKPRQVAEFLFGRDIGARLGVSEREWTRFLAREVTPRFPDGLTVTDARGQWRGRIAREPAKRVEIVLPGNADDTARLEAVVAAYKRQFHQDSVALIVRSACVAF